MEDRVSKTPIKDLLSEELSNEVQEDFVMMTAAEHIHLLSDDDKRWKELKNIDKETDIELKKTYGTCILGILIGWLAFVGLIILGQVGPIYHKLSDGVLITLITTSTANIIALPMIILKYLFPHNE